MWLTGRTAILVPKRLVEQLRQERAKHLPCETGGFLLGMRRGTHLEITEATIQGAADRATRLSFERRDQSHATAAQAAWNARSGFVGLIGDWHSHPSGPAQPSEADRHAWRTLVKSTKATCVGLIFAEYDAIGAFLARPSPTFGGVSPCGLIEETEDELVFATGSNAPPRL